MTAEERLKEYQPPDPNHPCTNCQASWGSQVHSVVDGVDYFKSEDCTETCERLKNYQIELYYSDTTDLDVKRCECGSIDFEYTDTRVFCIHCGLVSKKYSTASTKLE